MTRAWDGHSQLIQIDNSLFMHIKSTLESLFICPLLKKGDDWPILPSRFYLYLEFSAVSTLNTSLFSKGESLAWSKPEEVGFLRQPVSVGPELLPRLASLRLSGATGTLELHG